MPPRRLRFADLSIRRKLLAMGLLPLAVVLPLLAAILLLWGNAALDRLLITKVRSDLAVARGYFDRVLGQVGAGTRAVAESQALQAALDGGDSAAMAALLQAQKERHGVEFLNLLTPVGRLAVTEHGPVAPEQPRFALDVNAGEQAAVARLDAEQLELIAPGLRERLGIALVPTRNAAPNERAHEDRALLLLARAPVLDGQQPPRRPCAGRRAAEPQPAVHRPHQRHRLSERFACRSAAAAPRRCSSTTCASRPTCACSAAPERTRDGRSARASRSSVRDAVLGRGGTWLDRAFVVNDWYVSAYEPLVDGAGRRVGMLYVGYLERPFRLLKYGVLAASASSSSP